MLAKNHDAESGAGHGFQRIDEGAAWPQGARATDRWRRPGKQVHFAKSLEAAQKSDVIVYSIVVSDPEFYSVLGASYRGSASVRKLARETGGRTIQVKSVEQIGEAFEQIVRELRSQYLLVFSPSNRRHAGSFRRIRVKVPGHNYTVRARTGYYDRVEEKTETKNIN
jgi:VWFA-related protein